MMMSTHTLAEGQRVNYLANLGGLVVIAGLELIDPAVLLGALSEVARKLPTLPKTRFENLRQIGDQKLKDRQAQKRAFKAWQRAEQTERFDLTQDQMRTLILYLGGKVPALEKDIGSELRVLLKRIVNDSERT